MILGEPCCCPRTCTRDVTCHKAHLGCFIAEEETGSKGRFTKVSIKFNCDHEIAPPLGKGEVTIKIWLSLYTVCNKTPHKHLQLHHYTSPDPVSHLPSLLGTVGTVGLLVWDRCRPQAGFSPLFMSPQTLLFSGVRVFSKQDFWCFCHTIDTTNGKGKCHPGVYKQDKLE